MTKLSSLLAVTFLFAQTALADRWESIPATDFHVIAPPAEGSVIDLADHAALKVWQSRRTDAQCALAKEQETPTFRRIFARENGPLNRTEVRKAELLLSRVMLYTGSVTRYFKKKFSRPRPYTNDPELQPCVSRPSGDLSYPSGHASAGLAAACVLAEVFPDRAEALLREGRQVGDLRVISGVHHPSDVEAGHLLGRAVCERLLADPGFRTELKLLRAFVR